MPPAANSLSWVPWAIPVSWARITGTICSRSARSISGARCPVAVAEPLHAVPFADPGACARRTSSTTRSHHPTITSTSACAFRPETDTVSRNEALATATAPGPFPVFSRTRRHSARSWR